MHAASFFERFRADNPEDKRLQIATKIKELYPECLPVLLDATGELLAASEDACDCQTSDRLFADGSSPLPAKIDASGPLKRNKFLAPREMKVGQLTNVVRHKFLGSGALGPADALYVLAKNYTSEGRCRSSTAPPVAWSVEQAYASAASSDGFLYLVLAKEGTFGRV